MIAHHDQEHEFTLILTGREELTPALEEAILGKCEDGTLAVHCGRARVRFCRRAASIKDAILSAITDLRAAGVDVLRVDACNVVSQAEIARKIGKSRQMVHQYVAGARGPGGFPSPVSKRANDEPLWYWSEVAQWLWENDMVRESVFRDAEAIDAINVTLEYWAKMRHPSEIVREIKKAVESRKIA